MPRVLLLCEYPTLHGGERSLLAVLPRLTARGFSFCALAPDAGPLAGELRKRGVQILPWTARDAAGRKLAQPELREQVAAAVADIRPALVHANSLAMGRLSGPVMACLGQRSISHLRDIIGLSQQAVADLNQHTRLLAVSEATRAYHIEQGLRAEKTFVAYNGVDLEEFSSRPATGWLHRQLRIAREALLIGSIGQLTARKGLDVLLAAAATVAEQFPRAHWVIAGEGTSTKDEAQAFLAELHLVAGRPPLAGRVHFLGTIENVAELMPELSLLVHPARQEPLGRVLLEAAAAGLPIVATSVGGTAEIVSADSAVLVPPADAAALTAALEQMLADEGRRRSLAARALAVARRRFSVVAAAERLAAHYDDVLFGAVPQAST